MSVATGDTITQVFVLAHPTTGEVGDADSLPSGVLWVDGIVSAAAVTIADAAGAGHYTFTVTMPTLTSGQQVAVVIDAVFGAMDVSAVVWQSWCDVSVVPAPITETGYYGTVAGVSALIPVVGAINGASIPTSTQVVAWLTAATTEINLVMASAGYAYPVQTADEVYPFVAHLAELFSAARALQARGLDAMQGQDETKSQVMLREYNDQLKRLRELDLALMGVPANVSPAASAPRRVRTVNVVRVDRQPWPL